MEQAITSIHSSSHCTYAKEVSLRREECVEADGEEAVNLLREDYS